MISTFISLVLLTSLNLNANTVECSDDLKADLALGPGWRIGLREMVDLTNADPDILPDLKTRVALARFVDNGSEDFFSLIGSYVDVARFGLSSDSSREEARRQVLIPLIQFAVEQGFFPTTLDNEPTVRLLSNGFDESGTEREVVLPVAGDVQKFLEHVQNNPLDESITLRKIVTHSRAALEIFLLVFARKNHQPDLLPKLIPLFRARLLGIPQNEEFYEKIILDQAHDFLFGLAPQARGVSKSSVIKKSRADKARLKLDRDVRTIVLVGYIKDYGGALSKSESEPELEDSPKQNVELGFRFVKTINEILADDVYIDQKITPDLRNYALGILLGLKPLGGTVIRNRVAESLKQYFTELRTKWKVLGKSNPNLGAAVDTATPLAPTAPNLSVVPNPTRAERLKNYATAANSLPSPTEIPKPVSASTEDVRPIDVLVHSDQIPKFWSLHLFEGLSLDEIRQRLAHLIIADQTEYLPLDRSGFLYRVAISSRLKVQMLDPDNSGVADPRVWIEALKLGPARAEGQRGWRKLNTAIERIYDWEIKIAGSPYRMLGYRGQRGVWHFEKIVLMHR